METPLPPHLPEYIEIHLTDENLTTLYGHSEGQQKVLKIPFSEKDEKLNRANYRLIMPYSRFGRISFYALGMLQENLEKDLTEEQFAHVYVVSVRRKGKVWCGIQLYVTTALDKSIENN